VLMPFPEPILALAIGILGGLLSSLFYNLSRSFAYEVVIPFYQKIKYRSADVSGVWKAIIDNGANAAVIRGADVVNEANDAIDQSVGRVDPMAFGKSAFTLDLTQNAHEVTGKLLYSWESATDSNTNYTIDYSVKGEYWEGYLSLHCRTPNRKIFSQAACFFQVKVNGHALSGNYSFRSVAGEVQSLHLELFR
jgi:hypothetical protein